MATDLTDLIPPPPPPDSPPPLKLRKLNGVFTASFSGGNVLVVDKMPWREWVAVYRVRGIRAYLGVLT